MTTVGAVFLQRHKRERRGVFPLRSVRAVLHSFHVANSTLPGHTSASTARRLARLLERAAASARSLAIDSRNVQRQEDQCARVLRTKLRNVLHTLCQRKKNTPPSVARFFVENRKRYTIQGDKNTHL